MNRGRPLKFETPEEMQIIIDEYFNSCEPEIIKINDEIMRDSKGLPIYKMNPPTITGLALHLGFESRQSIYDYEDRKEFSYTMKTARLKCENFLESHGISGEIPPSISIFMLKNYGWTDKQEIEHKGNVVLNFDERLKDV